MVRSFISPGARLALRFVLPAYRAISTNLRARASRACGCGSAGTPRLARYLEDRECVQGWAVRPGAPPRSPEERVVRRTDHNSHFTACAGTLVAPPRSKCFPL